MDSLQVKDAVTTCDFDSEDMRRAVLDILDKAQHLPTLQLEEAAKRFGVAGNIFSVRERDLYASVITISFVPAQFNNDRRWYIITTAHGGRFTVFEQRDEDTLSIDKRLRIQICKKGRWVVCISRSPLP